MKKFLFLFLSLFFIGGLSFVKAEAETDITTLSWTQKGQNCTQDFNNENGGTVYGTDAGGANISYVDVSAYGTIKLYGTAGQTARLFINREEAGDDNGTFFVDINSDGVGTFDCNTVLTKQPKAQYIHLNGVKASAWNTHLNLSQITVSGSSITFPEPDPFVLLDGEVEINSLSWVNQGQSCANNLGSKTTSPIYGTDAGPSDGNLSYIDATDYSAVKLYGPDGTVRLFINRAEYAGGTFQFYVTIADGVGTLNFSDVFAKQEGATYIHINGVKASSPGAEAQVDHITLVEKPFEFPEGVTDLTTLPYVNEGQGCVNNLGTSTDATLYGTDAGPNGNNLSYIDVTKYSSVKLYGAAGDVVRLFINRAEYSNGTYQFFVTIGEDGVGTLNLADVYATQIGATYVHINGFKASQSWAATPDADGKALVNYIGVVNAISATTGSAPYSYVLTGAGELTVPAIRALADASATCYDATGVTGSGISLDAANKNALFKANKDVLANTSNVIVGTTCANFALTDGTTPFSSSVQFTATSVSYDRTFTEGQRSTVCLPYALTKEEVEAAGEFYELTDVEGSKLVFNKIEDGTEAYKPYIFKAKTDGALANLSNKAIPASVSAELSYEVSGYTFKGVLSHSADVAGDNAGKTVYGWSSTDGSFVKVGEGVAINAFRAYIISNENATPARLAAKFVDDSITGINEVNDSEAKNADGKFFENGKIVIIKNGVKYSAAGALLK